MDGTSTVPDESVIVLGAGPSGLGIARQLRHEHGIDALLVDRAHAPAASWRARYEGFRLNTCGFWSHLPGQHIPRSYGRWPTRDQMVDYFDDYVRRQALRLRLGVDVERIDTDGTHWRVTCAANSFRASAVVVATGNHRSPWSPPWPGMDGFTGDIWHAADYRNPWPLGGRDVLVVGSGNTAIEIALQLSDGVADRVRLSVRTPPHLVPRSAVGVPIDAFSPAFASMPVRVLDAAATGMRLLRFGDLSRHGLPLPRRGIYTSLREEHRVPTIGDRLVPRVKAGRIEIVGAVQSFDGRHVILSTGSSITPDVVVAATGYRSRLEPLVGHLGVLADDGRPVTNGVPAAAAGMWFAGYEEPLIGPLRAFRRQASRVAGDVAGHVLRSGRTRGGGS